MVGKIAVFGELVQTILNFGKKRKLNQQIVRVLDYRKEVRGKSEWKVKNDFRWFVILLNAIPSNAIPDHLPNSTS